MTDYLGVTLLEAQQAGAETTLNAGTVKILALSNLSVLDRDLTVPAGTEVDGDRLFVATGGTGVFSGHDDEIAYLFNSTWYFAVPRAGQTMYVEDEDTLLVYTGSVWNTII